jgi:hypothetical protein
MNVLHGYPPLDNFVYPKEGFVNMPDLSLDAEGALAYLAPNPWKLESAIERCPQVECRVTRETG